MIDGEVVIDPALAGRVAVTAAHLQSGEFWPGAHLGLTQRESEVLELMVQGLSEPGDRPEARSSARRRSRRTRRAIYRKLEVEDRGQAIAVALREGVFH